MLSYLPITIFHNCCLSGPYLGKYKRNWNETWFVDRWQWEEGQCTRTILQPCIFTKLSLLNLLFFIVDACLGHILESTKLQKDWNETWFIDRWQREEVQCTRIITLPCILLSYLPLTIFSIMVSYDLAISWKVLKGLKSYIDVNERKYKQQEP